MTLSTEGELRASLVIPMAALVTAALAMAALARPAAAAQMRVGWETWLRAGPSDAAPVIDELLAGRIVDVLACDAGWCRLGPDAGPGYVRQSTLAPARAPTLVRAPGSACFDATHATPAGPIPLRICPAVTAQ